MGTLRMTSVSLGFVSLVLVGCQNKLYDENVAMRNQNRELQSRLAQDDDRLKAAPDPAQLAAMQKDIADRDARIAELQASVKPTAADVVGNPGLAGIQTTYDAKAGTVTVNLPGDVLFDSGKATLKSSALATLDKIASAIKKDYPGKAIAVDGYTDIDPITKSREQWDDNWDLSYARAKSVTQYLVSHGVDQKSVSIVANGANKSKATKPASRRVEIVVQAK